MVGSRSFFVREKGPECGLMVGDMIKLWSAEKFTIYMNLWGRYKLDTWHKKPSLHLPYFNGSVAHVTMGRERNVLGFLVVIICGPKRNPHHFSKALVTWQSGCEVDLERDVVFSLWIHCVIGGEVYCYIHNIIIKIKLLGGYLHIILLRRPIWVVLLQNPNPIQLWPCRIPCHFLIQFLTCSIFGLMTSCEANLWGNLSFLNQWGNLDGGGHLSNQTQTSHMWWNFRCAYQNLILERKLKNINKKKKKKTPLESFVATLDAKMYKWITWSSTTRLWF